MPQNQINDEESPRTKLPAELQARLNAFLLQAQRESRRLAAQQDEECFRKPSAGGPIWAFYAQCAHIEVFARAFKEWGRHCLSYGNRLNKRETVERVIQFLERGFRAFEAAAPQFDFEQFHEDHAQFLEMVEPPPEQRIRERLARGVKGCRVVHFGAFEVGLGVRELRNRGAAHLRCVGAEPRPILMARAQPNRGDGCEEERPFQ